MRGGLAALTLATVATTVAGQDLSLNRPGSGARAAGMGNAFIAISDDGTAASWNPAGLSQLLKPEFSLVHTTNHFSRFAEGYRTRDESSFYTTLATGHSTADIEFASAAVPFRLAGKPVTLQIGWRRLYQLDTRVEGTVRRVALSPTERPESTVQLDVTTEGSISLWSVAGAVGLTNRLSVGWSLDFYRGTWEELGNTNETPGILGPTDFLSTVQLDEISGQALNLGVLLAYPSVSVGFVYHGALQGDFSESGIMRSSLLEPVDESSPPGGELHFPKSIGAGVAWRPKPLLRLAVDVTYNEWTRFLIDPTGGDAGDALSAFDGLPPELSSARDTFSVNAGMEKLFPTKGLFIPLRLGATYEPHGGRDPLLRDDLTYYVLAAGTGLNTNSLKFDVALEYRWSSVRTSENLSVVYQANRAQEFSLPPGPEVQGTLRFQQWRLKVSVIYRLTNTKKVSDFFKKVFGS